MSRWRTQRKLLNRVTAEVVTWPALADADRTLEVIRAWDKATWQAAELAILMQGIGPYLHHTLPSTPIYEALPATFRQRLADGYQLNDARLKRLLRDLVDILDAAHRGGLALMPLKGPLLATGSYDSPALRPMADLDLLVRPSDLPALAAILHDLGYQSRPQSSPGGSVHIFHRPDNRTVVSRRSNHPDNPRPVEVHIRLKKYFWDIYRLDDLTDYLWAESQPGQLLGAQAWLPAPARFLTYLAVHTMVHHLFGEGRLIHLLDLAHVAPTLGSLPVRHARWTYPVLCLAGRVLPGRFEGLALSTLAPERPTRLRRWAETVPLDGRCGLNVDPRPPHEKGRWELRWLRWRPNPLRLALAYGDTPLLFAYGRHFFTIFRRLLEGI
ncbi:MAG: nucleotidyltransferase family protein [Anaerolineae bacterium]